MGSGVSQLLVSVDPGPPLRGGLDLWLDGDSWDGSTTWSDKSGAGNHATTSSSTYIAVESVSGNGSTKTFNALWIKLVTGTYGSVTIPSYTYGSSYTLFHVCRYRGVSNNRILQMTTANWLSGFWSNDKYNCFHQGWVTAVGGHGTDSDWVYGTDQLSLYRGDGTSYGTNTGTSTTDVLGVNNWASGEKSDCNVALVLRYNTALSASDYALVEAWIADKYGL